ncbi:helix-turn-helix domain-containing protein [Vallitalea longa]|uniref:helix-turn-helix domain-containing protein n=1 Tax=Vallitalea longa TaxID=2936439 RepID=UPI00336597A3
MDYIENNYVHTIKLEELADIVHVNSSYLSRLFRKETGETLTNTITKIRIEKSKQLLKACDDKTYKIASMVGFEDAAYFSHIFKKHTGLSPSEYRKINT